MTRVPLLVLLAVLVASTAPAAPAPLPRPERGGPNVGAVLADLVARGYDLDSLRLVGGDRWVIQCVLELETNRNAWTVTLPFCVRAPGRLAALRAFQQGRGRLFEPDRVHGGLQ
jgi:hypothetical protein